MRRPWTSMVGARVTTRATARATATWEDRPDEPPDHSYRACAAGDRNLFTGGARRRHRLPFRPGASGSGQHAAGERRHRGADSPRIRQSQGRRRGRRRLARAGGQDECLSDRSCAFREGQRDHGDLLRQALPGACRGGRRAASARCAGRDRVHPAPGVKSQRQAAPAQAADPGGRPVTALRGVGAALAEWLAKLGVTRVAELMFLLPLRYEDRTQLSPIGSLEPGTRAAVEAEIQLCEIAYRGRRQLLCRIADGSGMLTLRFFYFSASQQQNLARGTRVRCFGEVRRGPLGLEMVHPEYRRLGAGAAPLEECLTPIYPGTEGVAQGRLRALITQALRELDSAAVRDWIPQHILAPLGLPSLKDALAYMHRPPREVRLAEFAASRHPAQRRLAFEELLAHHLSLKFMKRAVQSGRAGMVDDRE